MATLRLKVGVDVTGADKLQNLGNNLAGVGKGLTTFVTAPLIAAGGAAFKFASDLQEASSKAETVFGRAATGIQDNADDLTDAFSEAQYLDIAGTFGNITLAMGFTEKESADLAAQWIDMAQDFSSFNNLPTEQTLGAIRSAITGEFEPLKQMGIILNQAAVEQEALNLGIWDGEAALTAQQKTLAINSLIMQQAGVQLGDYDRTSEGAANTTKQLTANFTDAAAQIGTHLLPAGTALLGMVNSWLQAFGGLSPEMQGIIVKLALVVAAIGPVLFIGGKLIASFQAIGAAFSALKLLLLANPFVALAAAAAAIVVLIVANWDTIVAAFNTAFEAIGRIVKSIAHALAGTWTRITNAVSKAWEGIIGIIKGTINGIIGLINNFIGFINGIQIHIPAVGVGPFQTPAFDWWGLNLGKIPYLAEGGIVSSPTLAMIGEAGPEAVVPLDRMGNHYETHIHLVNEGDPITEDDDVIETLQLLTPYIDGRFRPVGAG